MDPLVEQQLEVAKAGVFTASVALETIFALLDPQEKPLEGPESPVESLPATTTPSAPPLEPETMRAHILADDETPETFGS